MKLAQLKTFAIYIFHQNNHLLLTGEIKLYKDTYTTPTINLNKTYLNNNTIDLFRYSPKIIVRGVSQEVSAIIDFDGAGLLVAVHTVIPKNPKNIYYLLGILNSKLINWFHLKTIYSIRIPQGSLKYPGLTRKLVSG